MAQANGSTPEASSSLPAEVPLVQNGPPFAASAPPVPATAPPVPATAPPLAATAPPVVETPPPHEELPPPARTDSSVAPEQVMPPSAALPEPPPPRAPERSVPPRPVPDLDPMPVTAADFEDEPGPGLLASLGSTRPTQAWLVVGLVALGLAFGIGLFVGRGTQPEPAPRAAAFEPARSPTTATPTPAPEPAQNGATQTSAVPVAADTPDAPRSAPTTVPVSALTDVSKVAAPSRGLSPFDSKLANTSIASAAARVKGCKDLKVPPGSASVVVTFATTGRVVAAAVTTPAYSTGRVGSCIVSKLKTAQVPPFSGSPETVKKTINLR